MTFGFIIFKYSAHLSDMDPILCMFSTNLWTLTISSWDKSTLGCVILSVWKLSQCKNSVNIVWWIVLYQLNPSFFLLLCVDYLLIHPKFGIQLYLNLCIYWLWVFANFMPNCFLKNIKGCISKDQTFFFTNFL